MHAIYELLTCNECRRLSQFRRWSVKSDYTHTYTSRQSEKRTRINAMILWAGIGIVAIVTVIIIIIIIVIIIMDFDEYD